MVDVVLAAVYIGWTLYLIEYLESVITTVTATASSSRVSRKSCIPATTSTEGPNGTSQSLEGVDLRKFQKRKTGLLARRPLRRLGLPKREVSVSSKELKES